MTAREPLPATPRKAMTPARRARVQARYEGCATIGCEAPGPYEIDHFICLELGGKDDDSNLRPLCVECHKRKTRLDRKLIAKASKRREKHLIRKGPDAQPRTKYMPARRIQNRPFPEAKGSLSHPTLKRTLSGQVVPR